MASGELKTKARDELVRVTERETGGRFSELSEKQKSIAAAKFYVREIHNPVKNYISDDDVVEGLVDGKNDLGCDFIHRDDGHVFIMQAKYRSPSSEEAADSVSYFQGILGRFLNRSLSPNKHLLEVLNDIDWENDTFDFVFQTFAKFTPQARTIGSQAPHYPTEIPNLELRSEWRFLDEEDLNIELRNARNIRRGPVEKHIRLFPVGEKGKRGVESVVQIDTGKYKSFIMALDAKQLKRCYEELGRDSIFSLNIRNYIGNTFTNKNIIATALSEPPNFFLYNNGISCLASRVTVSSDHLEVLGLQVINGAQTVKALVNLIQGRQRQLKGLWQDGDVPVVLVRITEIPDKYGDDAKIREKITQFNNTQNTIKISDFRSNDEVQESVKEQFKELSRAGKRVAYLPKRTDKVPPNSEIVRLEEFSKSVYAFLYEPTAFSGSSSFLFSLEKNGGYAKVFGDGSKIWERMPVDEFRLRAASYWIAQECSKYIKASREEEDDADSRAALERKWLVVYAAAAVFRFLHGESEWQNVVRQLYKGDWKVDDASEKGKQVRRVLDLAKLGVIQAYKNSKTYNPNFVHRNWMRSKDTPAELAGTIQATIIPLAKKFG